MSFNNPFVAQNGFEETISIEYFSGNPNFQTLNSPELVMVAKSLTRRDQTTREKGMVKLRELIPSLDIDDAEHLAYIQLYMKLCFDLSSDVRREAHTVLGLVYNKIGKKASKYLKYSLPCLVCGFYDPIASVASAANGAFETAFNTSERRQLAIKKFTPDLVEFSENIVINQTPQTLSDERYVSQEESTLKYDRILKQVLDMIAQVLLPEEVDLPLLNDKKLWKLASSANSTVAKATLNLAVAAIDRVDTEKVFTQLVKLLNKVPPQISVDTIRALLTYTKSHTELWNDAAQNALVIFIKNSHLFPSSFWPLFFNLVLITRYDSQLANALGGVAVKAIGPAQNDIWGCFLTLCSRNKSQENYNLAVNSIAKRASRPVPEALIKTISTRFKTFDHGMVAGLVKDNLKVFNFALIISATRTFTKELNIVCNNFNIHQKAQLVKEDPELDVKVDDSETDYKSLIEIAIYSNTVDSQALTERVVKQEPEIALQYSKQLKEKGVKIDLTDKLDLSSAAGLTKAISARGGLIDDESARTYVWSLATNAVEGDKASLTSLAEVASKDPSFVRETFHKTDLGSRLLTELHISQNSEVGPLLDTLNDSDSSDALVGELTGGQVEEFDILVERAVAITNKSQDELPRLLLLHDKWIPEDLWAGVDASVKYPFRYGIAEAANSEQFDSVLRVAAYLLNFINEIKDKFSELPEVQQQKCLASVALVSIACVGFEYTSTRSDLTSLANAFRKDSQALVAQVKNEILWEIVRSSDSSSAYYAAQILFARHPNDSSEYVQKYRTKLNTTSIFAALLAQLHAGAEYAWYSRSQQQMYNNVRNGVQLDADSLACIDSSVNKEMYIEMLIELTESADEPVLQEVLLILNELVDNPVLSPISVERIFQYGSPTSQLSALKSAPVNEFTREIARGAGRLEDDGSLQSEDLIKAYLEKCKPLATQDIGFEFKRTSKAPSIAWVHYCLKRGRALSNYRKQLETSECSNTELVGSYSNIAEWLLYLDLVAEYEKASTNLGRKCPTPTMMFSSYEETTKAILKYVSDQLKDGVLSSLSPSLHFEALENVIGNSGPATITLLYRAVTEFGDDVREWYRSLSDRALLKSVDQCLQEYISPIIMRVLAAQVRDLRQDGVLEATSVSERAREFRAMLEIDEATAQVAISLDPLFPIKSASVQLIGLNGIPEHKKRGWIIEAEYTVRNGAIIDAMRTLLVKIDNFLEGFEPCSICYSVMLGKSLPNKTCATCKNTYHTDCLYKWFSSNKNKQCPMCRSNM